MKPIILYGVLLLTASCAHSAQVQRSPAEQIRTAQGRDVEALLRTGDTVLLRTPRIEGDSVFGGWRSGPEGDRQTVVALADIERVRVVSPSADQRVLARSVKQMAVVVLLAPAALLLYLIFSGNPW